MNDKDKVWQPCPHGGALSRSLNATIARRARDRAAESARDAAECIDLGRIGDARSLLAEASRHLDEAERRAGQ